MKTIRLDLEPVTAAAFAPFGVLPPDEGDGHATADLEFLHNDGWVNYIAHSLDEITVTEDGYRCDLLNRHDTHTQTLMPMSGRALIVVAPAAVDFSDAAHFDTVHAFDIPQYGCVHLAAERGIGARIRWARPTCGSSTSRAGAIPTTTALRTLSEITGSPTS